MRPLASAIATLSPAGLLRLYLGAVLVACVVAAVVVYLTSSEISRRAEQSTNEANAALISAETQTVVSTQTEILATARGQFSTTPTFLSLALEAQAAVTRELSRDARVDAGPAEADVPRLEILLDQKQAAELQASADQLIRDVDEVLKISGHVDAERLGAARDRYRTTLSAFLAEPTLGVQRSLMVQGRALGDLLQASSAAATKGFAHNQKALAGATGFATATMLLSLGLLTVAIGASTLSVGRLLQKAFAGAEAEKARLNQTKETLQYRNDQLNALYNVFSEITGTLSLRHVIDATLRETMLLMKAQRAILGQLKDGMIDVIGSLTADGEQVRGLPPLALGEGAIGRTAKRGRTLRIDETNQDSMPPWQREAGSRSGLVVPLIVGARVIGILSCWSSEASAFGEEEERVLEMMASQVANAIVAADLTERSERRALQDPLTGLSNRLQLSEDLESDLSEIAKSERSAVVAMIDIDNFKRLNDAFGHSTGDLCLQKAAAMMRSSIREKDRVYRYGGEEFVMIFVDATAREAITLADRLRARFASTPLSEAPEQEIGPLTISIGLAVLPGDGRDVNALIDMADGAMYRAKEAGGNRVTLWSDEGLYADPFERITG